MCCAHHVRRGPLTRARDQNYFNVSTFLWVCCIAVNHLLSVRKSDSAGQRYEIAYVLVCTLVPAICTIIPLIFHMYTRLLPPNDVGCWFGEDFEWARIVFFDGWILASWLFVVVVLVIVQREVNTMGDFGKLYPSFLEESLAARKLVRNLMLCFSLSWVWSFVRGPLLGHCFVRL